MTEAQTPTNAPEVATPSNAHNAWRRFRRNRPALISLWVLGIVVLLVIAWPLLLKTATFAGSQGVRFAETYQPERLSDAQFQPPNFRHWFGTDIHGRDLLSRVLHGAQVSLLVGIVGAGVSLIIG